MIKCKSKWLPSINLWLLELRTLIVCCCFALCLLLGNAFCLAKMFMTVCLCILTASIVWNFFGAVYLLMYFYHYFCSFPVLCMCATCIWKRHWVVYSALIAVTRIEWSWYNPRSRHIAASLDETLYGAFLLLGEASGKLSEHSFNTTNDNLETWKTLKLLRIRPKYSTAVAMP